MKTPHKGSDPTIEDLEQGLLIDELALDEACARNPDLFYRAAKRHALEQSRRDAHKQALAEAEAAADLNIRRDLEMHDERATDKKVASAVMLDKAVRIARDALHAASKSVGDWGALKEAYIQRGYALNNMVTLYTANYFGEVEGGRSAKRATNVKGEQGREHVRRRLRRQENE